MVDRDSLVKLTLHQISTLGLGRSCLNIIFRSRDIGVFEILIRDIGDLEIMIRDIGNCEISI